MAISLYQQDILSFGKARQLANMSKWEFHNELGKEKGKQLTQKAIRFYGEMVGKKVREKTGLPVVTEVMNTADVDLVEEYSDILQIAPATSRTSPF
jgi:hypothetical protein